MAEVCVIGAGSSGIASCQVLAARGLDFDCFEKGSGVGGNWRYENDNGMSAAYRSLHINTSKRLMEYATFPMPDDYPDYPSHGQIAAYFDSYVDHFGLRERIEFNTEVTRVEPVDGGWEVETGAGETRRYRAVMVANGHHWDAKWPEPAFPGQDTFAGDQLHAHDYREPDERFRDRDVLVLGIGNSACDIACEAARFASTTYLAMRRGAHVIPKYVEGKPTDELGSDWFTRLPFPVQRRLFAKKLRQVQGRMSDYGLPEPDHELGQAHPTISSELLPAIGHGRVKPKPNIERIEGEVVRFVDGSEAHVDTIVWCTGYRIRFPFLPRDVLDPAGNRVPLYRRVVHPDRPGLYFIGLIQPLGAIMPIAERQSEWVADLVEGAAALPPVEEMKREIEREERAMRERYVASTRHTIQVDFYPYMRQLARERARSRVSGSGQRTRRKAWQSRRPSRFRAPSRTGTARAARTGEGGRPSR